MKRSPLSLPLQILASALRHERFHERVFAGIHGTARAARRRRIDQLERAIEILVERNS